MSPTTAYLAKFIGAYSLFVGIWLALRRESALALVDRVSDDPVFESMIGVLRFAIGVAIVAGHNAWDGWVEALVSFIGWSALLTGLATMFLPAGTMRRVVVGIRLKDRLSAYALGSALIGAGLLLAGVAG